MKYLTLNEVIELHDYLIAQFGGSSGIRDKGALESALAQPRATFGRIDLYPTLVEKAISLGFSLIQNHAFVDGNKRIGHLAMEIFLRMNGYKINAPIDEQENIILQVASSKFGRDEFKNWLEIHLIEY